MIESVVFYSCDYFGDELRMKKDVVKVKKETEKMLYLDSNNSYYRQIRKDDIGELIKAFGLKMFLLEENDELYKKAILNSYQSEMHKLNEKIEYLEKCIEKVKGYEL